MSIPAPSRPEHRTPPLVESLTRLASAARGMVDNVGATIAMTCAEHDAIVGVLRAIGEHSTADAWEAEHAGVHVALRDEHAPVFPEPAAAPLPYLFDERVRGMSLVSTAWGTGEAREFYDESGYRAQYLAADGEWRDLPN